MSEMVRKYELIYIHPGSLPSEDVEQVDEILNGTLERMEGELLYREDWGVRSLAYQVKKNAEGRYILVRLACSPDCLNEIERRFKITESVIKFLSIRLADNYVQEVIPEVIEEAATEETATEKVVTEEAATKEVVEAAAEEIVSEVEAAGSSDDAEDENPGEE